MTIKNCTTCFYGTFEEYQDSPCEVCSIRGNGHNSKWLDCNAYQEDEPKQVGVAITLHLDNKDFFVIKKLLASITVAVEHYESSDL